ncbi:DUF5676 family membrane protein [Dictyobacter aurantiacus]|uniref:Uncharacterized protein n=1 Tax=Dictyobacter aurantiacus TaxID=1936993 RepID=A0A401Z9D6_9CHLR|nr:DUF5676 family membrane protein [Dictyobacter aurantiacus]GCE03423.1 hypothetical protein KDAU_07520 [Dictyobacter aurantiacus]
MKEEKIALANAFAVTVAILWTVCSLVVAIFPAFALDVTTWWMHGLTVMGTWHLTWGNFFLGGIVLVVIAWLSAYLFGWCWETFSGKRIALHRQGSLREA